MLLNILGFCSIVILIGIICYIYIVYWDNNLESHTDILICENCGTVIDVKQYMVRHEAQVYSREFLCTECVEEYKNENKTIFY